ncbi:hypothetical protein [Peribacillus kribbensis]|uniref:hypothetical protein n=1 Tax=Peribacillus kribbensis TaxID=356658 RepID=UPI00047D73E3|nr:hypothetical protein [Peribacillus kribbensis]
MKPEKLFEVIQSNRSTEEGNFCFMLKVRDQTKIRPIIVSAKKLMMNGTVSFWECDPRTMDKGIGIQFSGVIRKEKIPLMSK